jgi:GWxTD domain-containing protein
VTLRHLTLAALALCVSSAVSAQQGTRTIGQAPPGADTLSPGAVNDSLAVLRSLDSVVTRNPRDAAAWYRRGMIAWALAYRDTIPPSIEATDWTLLSRMADTSLRRAAQAAPTNPLYHLTVGRYLLASGNAVARVGANTHFAKAVEVAAAGDDDWMKAETLVELGRADWRGYDQFANRMPTTTGALRSIAAAVNIDAGATMGSLLQIVDAARDANRMISTAESGRADYIKAEANFRKAYEVYPAHVRAYRNLAMLLAEKQRWTELATLGRDKVSRTPWDYLGWMTLGLASHRLGDAEAATAAFDSALTYIPDEEYRRVDNIERILRRRDTAMVGVRDAELRPATTRLYWLLADPLWSRKGNEARIEFLARVTFAELRWTVDELGVRGADTDRGDVYVRYGPADYVLAWGPEPDDPSFEGRSISTLWSYEITGLSFVFQGQASFGTARIPLSDRTFQELQREDVPVRWDNARSVEVDTIPVQSVRFRGTADSVDVLVAAAPPVGPIRASSTRALDVRTDFWLLAGGTVGVKRDSTMDFPGGVQSWQYRVPAGTYVYRIEASANDATKAARSTAALVAGSDPLSGFALGGFGVSDVLLATRAQPRAGVTPQRWSDLELRPLAGPLAAGADLSVAWETYGIASANGSAAYSIAITIRRESSGAGRVAARVLRGVTGISIGDDEVAILFDRTVAHRDALVEYLDLALGETPAGAYRLTLKITDRTTGQSTERVTRFTIAG